jgi:hypothetical protein
MKTYKPVLIILLAIGGMFVSFFLVSMQVATKREFFDKSLSVNLGEYLPKGAKLVEIKKDKAPPLMEFLLESDYVVIATVDRGTIIGKRGTDPLHSDASERMVGYVEPLRIESIVFSKRTFEDGVALFSVKYPALELYSKIGNVDDVVLKGTRYLLFLKAIPKDEEIFTTLELDKDKTYYRTFVGNQSLFPHSGISMEGPSKRGKINLSTGGDSKLAESIRRFCEALSSGDNDTRIRNLRKLANSNDQTLRENAEFAAKYLSK